MAESLNKAFIKAYRKVREGGASESHDEETSSKHEVRDEANSERPKAVNEAASNPAKTESDSGTEYIVRVDTTSVKIPQPHMLRKRGQSGKSAVAVTSAEPKSELSEVVSSSTASNLNNPKVSPENVAAEEANTGTTEDLRDSIVEQMRDAILIDASLPPSGHVQIVEPFWASLPSVGDGANNTEGGDQDSSPEPVPPESQSASASDADFNSSASRPEDDHHHDQGNLGDEQGLSDYEQTPIESNNSQHSGDSEESIHPSVSEHPGLEPPDAPALSVDEVRNLIEEYAQKKGRTGEIFRLDEPTYGEKSNEDLEDSGDSENSLDHPSLTSIDYDEELAAQRWEEAREVEEDLRQAQTKRFNAAWEVDEFQWPAVCEELLRRGESRLEKVASNLARATHEGLQVLAVTSPQGGEGRTTVACCLAKMAAVSGLRVAFVDGDIENPSLSYQTNLDIDFDWRTAILNQLPLEEVAVHSIRDQITLIPLLSPVAEHEFAPGDNRVAFMLHQLSESFDLVVVDMGHMESTRNLVSSLAQQGIINAVVTVVDHRISNPERVEACIRRIRRSGVASVGLVENFAA
ncbi:MAG: AAA family ATPase [Planctomycetota bacterium]